MDQSRQSYRPALGLDVQRHHLDAQREYYAAMAPESYDAREGLLSSAVGALVALFVRHQRARRQGSASEPLVKVTESP